MQCDPSVSTGRTAAFQRRDIVIGARPRGCALCTLKGEVGASTGFDALLGMSASVEGYAKVMKIRFSGERRPI